MSTRRGRDWGEPTSTPPDVVLGRDDEIGAAVDTARREKRELPVIGLVDGDLCRTLGGGRQPDRLRENTTRLSVDVGCAQLDGRQHWFVAHCVARRPFWSGRSVAVMNAAFLGDWNMAPRAHPNDGRLDVVEVEMSWGDRMQARRRVRTGSHVPHPGIAQRRIRAGQWSFERPVTVRLDGRVTARVRDLAVTVEPDALQVVI